MRLNPWPVFDEIDISSCSKVLSSGKVNYFTGEQGLIFEKEFAAWTNNKYSVALANGTLALSSAYYSLGLNLNDEVITSPRTFIATSSTLVLQGCKPVFADVNRDSGLIDTNSIEPLITNKTKAISIVHLGGWPADMPAICDLAKSYNIKVVEDCSQAHGAQILHNNNWSSVGSFGDVSTWSFCQDKIMTTGGEGGMITTNNKKIWEKIWSYKDHGKNYKLFKEPKKNNSFKWLHEEFGSNYRMTEMQSTIGRNQLLKIKEWNRLRTRNANLLISSLSPLNLIRIPTPHSNLKHAWYKFYCYLDYKFVKSDWDRERIIHEISTLGYPAYTGGCSEIYLEKCFQKIGYSNMQRLVNARELGETSLMFLIHPSITYDQMINYCEAIKNVLKSASI